MPFVTPGVILVATVNSIGAAFQFIYAIIFIIYADKSKKLRMSALLMAVFAFFGMVVFVSLRFLETHLRQMVVGYLSVFSLISMFASPLFIINLVIKTQSVEYMPFYLSLSTFLTSLSFSTYGVLKFDPFLYVSMFLQVPNGIGTILGIVQLAIYYYYSNKYGEGSREPLLASYA
ncbi:SWEET2c [Populus alba x Populus x berolinensis]|uniref:SWEET2c n=2 Tax=Populus TaxID=3689 RepID=A0AAD6RS88_9ROSI|nr:SWEET2c [Populus alba x Populus x berolinensis]